MIEAIVLAAGLGTRMRATKPLLVIGGQPALAVVLKRIRAAGIARPIVVLGHDEDALRAAVDLTDCRVPVNPHPERGMGTSLAIGIAAIDAEAAGVLVFHADMPFVREGTVRSVLSAAAAGARIAAPAYRGNRGFPVFFHRSCLLELSETLTGEEGGRIYLRAHARDLILVDVDDPGCLQDLDRPDDLVGSEASSDPSA